jgi:cytosine/adenosine deaminase-related metal-dependent hydrolase
MKLSVRARWIFPVSSPPLEGGTVTVDDDRIQAVGLSGGAADVDLGNAALLPGLVNAHTHLDLTGLRGLAPPSPDFTGWLREVIAHRRSRTPEQTRQDVQAGLSECLCFGTTLLGDISGDGTSWDVLKEAPLRAVVFRELLGLTKERAEEALAVARVWLETHAGSETCRPGLSPHAPYSVRAELLGQAALLAREHRCPLAVHLAESLAELELLHHRRGPLVPFLKELASWDADGLATSPSAVMKVCDQYIPKSFVHGNHLAPSARIPRKSTIIYCPRTHAVFGHPPHPFRDFLARGIRVALGTDSLASNPDLDLLAEARFLHRLHPDLPGEMLLRMATLSGAEALGWADQAGSLEPGKSADLAVLPLPDKDGSDPHRLLFGSCRPVRAVLSRGHWLFDREGVLAPTPDQLWP